MASFESTVDAAAFYRDLLFELGEHARRRGATAYGAAVVAKRGAVAHGLAEAGRLPLPRPTRAELVDAAWEAREVALDAGDART